MLRMVIWDWNGTLQNDARHFYLAGACRIFRHFNLPSPDFDTHRLECQHDWLAYYHRKGVPVEVGRDDLNVILRAGMAELGPAPLFDDALETVAAFGDADITNVMVSGQADDILQAEIGRHSFRFAGVYGGVKDKAAKFRGCMEDAFMAPSETVVVGDMVNDAEAAQAVGCRSFICPRGFHSAEHVRAAQTRLPNMIVVASLTVLRQLLLSQ